MGAQTSRAPPADDPAPPEAPVEWLTLLQDCATPGVELAVWED